MRWKIVVVSAMGVAVVLLAWLAFRQGINHIRTSFAAEQVRVFFELAEKAEDVEPIEAVGYLEYVITYYPSGSKQVTGSKLDEIVETCREVAAARILAVLREQTGKDLGLDPATWRKAIQ